ncbi:MAG: UbiX family flavin prenyltransferase [Desulfobacteraceae bacterium]|nr:UbiX family flavin prenyltransferase [Desulfobacteraceae bacterium]
MKPVVVGICGASGVIYGVELLKILKNIGRPVHLIISHSGIYNLTLETNYTLEKIRHIADVVHDVDNFAASVASGSFLTEGMIVAPCTVKTLSAIANSFDYNVLVRAADVTLKEKRPLVLMVRETPLHKGHLDLMARTAELGAFILPPVPAFYHQPNTIEDIIHQSLGKALDCLGIENDLFHRWPMP